MKIPAGLEKLFQTTEPPELGPGPRDGVLAETELNHALDASLAGSKLSPRSQNLIRALALLWHDHLDAAHIIAQDIETSDGSFVHGIMHRREPDYGNAKYWFRRVGQHASFPEIARRVGELLDSNGATNLKAKLIPRGQWDSIAFVDFCERAAHHPATDLNHKLAREIQRIETEVLLEFLSTWVAWDNFPKDNCSARPCC